ncbi:MAG: VWA domain-containing protein [Pyrinomonadaceae bacterium]
MKNLALLTLFLATLAYSGLGQSSTGTRPRVAPTATPPPTLGNDTSRAPVQSAPPVLRGGTRPAAIPAATPPVEDDDGGIIKVETNLVTMPVAVLDRDGRFISGLQQRDFKIFENGIEQKVDYFQSVEQPFTVILLIDVSPSTQFAIDEIQNAAIAFINQLRPDDRVMVIAFDERVHVLSPATNNRYQLRNAIRQTQFGDGTSLYEAVDFVIDQQLRHIQGRKAVVLFTDGVDTTSRRASYESSLRNTEEIDALFYPIRYDTARDMGVSTYPGQSRRGSGRVTMADILGSIITGAPITMGRGGYPGRPNMGEYERGKRYLELLAQNSGGRGFEAQSLHNVDAAFAGIAEELRRQYSLGYYPDNVGRIGDRKQIRVRVMRPDVMVRAKNSYIVGQSNRTPNGR